jgi:hypothetical protein
MSGGVSLPSWGFQLSFLLLDAKQTNPLLKDFLKQFSAGTDSDANVSPFSHQSFTFDEFEALEASLSRDDAVPEIRQRLEDSQAEFILSLWQVPSLSKSVDRFTSKHKFEDARSAYRVREEAKHRQFEDRLRLMKTPITKSDMQESEEKHQKFLDPLHHSRFYDTPLSPDVNKKDQAKENRRHIEEYAAQLKEKHRKTLPLRAKPRQFGKAPIESRIPPFAQDLLDFKKRMNAEFQVLSTLKGHLARIQERDEGEVSGIHKRFVESIMDDEEIAVPDYHMQFAVLFQKLESAERNVVELAEKVENWR